MAKKRPEGRDWYRAYFDEGANELTLRGLNLLRAQCGSLNNPRFKIGFSFDDGCSYPESQVVEIIADQKLIDDMMDAFEAYAERSAKAWRG